jgi:ribosomal protein S4E
MMPTTWPIPRKGTTFIAKTAHAHNKGISVLTLLREVLGIVRTKKEAKHLALNNMIKINNKTRKNEVYPLQLFDTLSLEKANKHYRLEIINKKYALKEISAKEAETKIVKITGKTIQKNKTIQINLDDGQNYNTKETFNVGDSALLNTKENKITKILPLQKGATVEVIAGKHAGKKGTITGTEELERTKNYTIKLEDKEVNIPLRTIIVIQ